VVADRHRNTPGVPGIRRRLVEGNEMLIIIFSIIAILLGLYFWLRGIKSATRKLREVGAFSPETAVKPEKIKVWEVYLEQVAEKTSDGRYYLKKKNHKDEEL